MGNAVLKKYEGYPCIIGVFQGERLVAAVNCMQRWRAEDIAAEIGGTVRDLDEEPDFDWSIGSYEWEGPESVLFCNSVKTDNPAVIRKIWTENLFNSGLLMTRASRNYVAGSVWEDSAVEFPWAENRKKDVFCIPLYRRLYGRLKDSDRLVAQAADKFFDSVLVWATE